MEYFITGMMNSKYTWWMWLLCLSVFGLTACSKDSENSGGQNLSVSPERWEVSRLGETFKVTLESDAPWVSKCDEWLSVSPENGAAGKHTLTVTAQPQAASTVTEGKVVFSFVDGATSRELHISRVDAKSGRLADSLALVALYNATNGEEWTTRWNLKRPMDTWQQVRVEKVDGEMRVTEVMLRGFGLKGTIPEDIKYMDKLRYFSVENNNVSGDFPAFLCDMKQLQLITLAGNNFKGEIPAGVFDLPDLEYLVLKINHFSGKLPDNIGNCTSLKTLEIQANELSGEIPSSFSKLSKLRYIQVGGNRFTGQLPDLSAMDSLIGVEFSQTAVFKDVLEPQADEQSLERRQYVSGGFTGPAPNFENKPLLEKVLLYENHLSSSPRFTNCPKLTWVYMANNPIGSLDPSVTRDMPNLEILHIQDCELEQLPEFVNCPKLKFLVAPFNRLTRLPESMGTLSGMEEILIHANQLESLPENLSEWKVIRHILVGYNKLKSLPASIWTLPMYSLKASCNEIAGAFPAELYGARNLNTLYLDCNKMQGSVAPLTTLWNATDIRCSRNQFSGEIPEGFGKIAGLKILTLDDNELTGSIPADIAKCRSLEIFHLYNNRMSGEIPRSVLQGGKWCSWEPKKNILPQKAGAGFDPFEDPCRK